MRQGRKHLSGRPRQYGALQSAENKQIVQSLPKAELGMWNSPTWWSDHVYFGSAADHLKLFSFNPLSGLLSKAPISQSANTFLYPGTTTSVSANQASNAIVWALDNSTFKYTTVSAVLYAYDATDLTKMLYNSAEVPARDAAGPAVKFAVPTIANGKVYVGSRTAITV